MTNTFYTRSGDEGYTRWLGAGRIAKEDLRIEAVGTVDEAGAALGLARAHTCLPESAAVLLQVQRDFYGMMSELVSAPENAGRFQVIDQAKVDWLEAQTDAITAQVSVPREFIVPGDNPASAYFDQARVVVRRAERRVAELIHRGDVTNLALLRYLNRLSSLCFLLELREAAAQGGEGRISLAKE